MATIAASGSSGDVKDQFYLQAHLTSTSITYTTYRFMKFIWTPRGKFTDIEEVLNNELAAFFSQDKRKLYLVFHLYNIKAHQELTLCLKDKSIRHEPNSVYLRVTQYNPSSCSAITWKFDEVHIQKPCGTWPWFLYIRSAGGIFTGGSFGCEHDAILHNKSD